MYPKTSPPETWYFELFLNPSNWQSSDSRASPQPYYTHPQLGFFYSEIFFALAQHEFFGLGFFLFYNVINLFWLRDLPKSSAIKIKVVFCVGVFCWRHISITQSMLKLTNHGEANAIVTRLELLPQPDPSEAICCSDVTQHTTVAYRLCTRNSRLKKHFNLEFASKLLRVMMFMNVSLRHYICCFRPWALLAQAYFY